ncbi:hypothetical protein DRW71_25295 [Salmonella enterica subsp. diarizonae]|nr:hypothetical protein [Salmonella enterica]EBV2375044.1 hypothetical protein [Salmonella enterica subsp. enterica serovar Enteritidis]ECC9192930.1 hypothetical protein [Salmonella enterica subsp. diarizonae]EGX1468780.1 hypothetical protein [Salmonella enterica]
MWEVHGKRAGQCLPRSNHTAAPQRFSRPTSKTETHTGGATAALPDHHGKKRKVLSSGSSQYGASASRFFALYENFFGEKRVGTSFFNVMFYLSLSKKEATYQTVILSFLWVFVSYLIFLCLAGIRLFSAFACIVRYVFFKK